MSIVVAAIAVFPVLTVLMIGLAKAENLLSGTAVPVSTPAELPTPAPAPVTDTTVS